MVTPSEYGLTTSAAGVVAPGPEVALPVAISLADLPEEKIRAILHEVEYASLVQQPVPGRYRMHDLFRLYATDIAQHDLSDDAGEAAPRRVLDCYVHAPNTAS